MSLNGLDDAKVKEAHDAAVAEPGGWFLLKYVSRDEIDLLGRGNGGIVEIRNAIASYEEPSPLFGFLRYRRRNVIIKYVPDDCSRLVQARVTVHFNAVTERFSPHDTVFPIRSSKDLRDTTLSAACSLHTASGSTSSSTSSLRRRRLMEIAEDTEEENRAKRQSTVPEETRPSTAKTTTSQPTGPAFAQDQPPSVPELTKEIENSPSLPNLETSPPPPREPRASIDEPQPRLSSQSTRPNLFSYTSYGSNGKPKVKLGPRPSLDTGKQRPHTSGAASLYRPISTLPAGLKLFSRGSKKGKESKERPKSHYATEGVSINLSPPSVPESMALSPQTAPARPHTSGGRPNTSSGASIKPLASPTASHTPKLPTITPEKARLMKALELRKKQKSSTPTITTTGTTETSSTANEIAKAPTAMSGQPESMEAPQDVPKTPDMLDDSAIAFDAASANKTDESDATRTDSYPTSPVGPSSKAESTRASSISESTDETVYAASKPVEEASGEKVAQVQPTGPADSESAQDTPTMAKVEHNILVDPVPVAKEGADQGIKAEASTNLPQLQAMTYEPPPFSIAVPVPEHQREPKTVESVPPKEEGKAAAPKDPDAEARAEIAKINAEIKAEMEAAAAAERSLSETADNGGKSSEGAISSDAVVAEASALKTESREMKIPRSKFSMPDLKAANDIPTITTEPVPAYNNQESPTLRSKFSTQDSKAGGGTEEVVADPPTTSESQATLKPTSSVGSISSHPEDGADNGGLSRKKSKRRGLIEPIRTDLEVSDRSGGTSEANFSSDDELMDELQSAVIEDAKPISVSKSPLSPVFPSSSPTKKEGNRFSRAFSNPLGRKSSTKSEMLAAPDTPTSTRSVSASAYLNRISQQPSAPMAKKVNLGGGIAQRIKALEQLQSSAPGSTPAPGTSGPPPGSTPAFFSVRKSVVRPVSRSPSIAERANSLTKNSPGNSRESSPEAFKLRERSGSVQNRLDAFKSSPLPSSSSPGRARPESISVTARIIRDPNQPYPQKPEVGKDPLDYAPVDFKQSPLVIDHQKAIATEAVAHKETIQERRLSKESKKERRSSITVVKDLINEGRKSLSERRRSITLEPSSPEKAMKSPSRPPSVHASPAFHKPMSIRSGKSVSSPTISPPPTANSASSVEDKSDKKPNRASRMIRRMSSSLSKGRNNISHAISPTVREDPEPESHDIDTRSIISSVFPSQTSMVMTPTLSDVGDVNVQFPDTLLWKRRSMGLDSQGFLVLAPALSAHKVGDKATTRRFHLSEFSTPAIPEMEMQELPNSVVLDFLEGSGLQIACEDRAGQTRVLRVLQDAHRLWTTQ